MGANTHCRSSALLRGGTDSPFVFTRGRQSSAMDFLAAGSVKRRASAGSSSFVEISSKITS